MRYPIFSSLALIILAVFFASPPAAASGDHAIIERRRIVIVRTGELARQFPERRRAVVNYPVISGLPAPVLREVRSALEIKNIFDTSLAEYREDAWLTEFDYRVNYNKNYILDITFTQSGVGAYPDTQSRHFAFNLKTGTILNARAVFKPDALAQLAGLVNERLQAEVREKAGEVGRRDDVESDEKDSVKQSLGELSFKPDDLDEFAVGDGGVTFLYDAGFPHVIQAAQPEGRYFFSYARLSKFIKRDGPLGRLVGR
jgi:hypothetical protein